MQKCNCTYLLFWAFLVMSVTILARDHIEIWFYFKYAYLKEHISAFEKILSFGHQVILPLKHCICEKKIVLKVGFQNIFFLLYGLLGISANFNKKMPENRIFCDFEAWSLWVPMRSHVLFFFSLHFHAQNTETITKGCDQLSTIKYCLLIFKFFQDFKFWEYFCQPHFWLERIFFGNYFALI